MTRPTRRALLGVLAACAPGPVRAQGLRDLLEPLRGPVFDLGRDRTGPLLLEPGPESAITPGRLNGAPVRVLFDSGAERSVVDLALARRLRLAAGAPFDVRDAAGRSAPAVTLDGVALRLPGLTFHDLAAVAVDLAPLAQTGQSPPVILGAEAFASLLFALDRDAGTAEFARAGRLAPPPGARPLPLLADGGRARRFPLQLGGAGTVWTQFDLGSQAPLTGAYAEASARGWLRGRRVSTWAAATVAAVARERIASLPDVSFAGAPLPPTPVELLDTWTAADTPLVAGFPLLSRFRLLVDYGADRLWAAPLPGLNAPFARDRSGLALRPGPGGRARVAHVALGSPAAAAGWREGEELVSVRDANGAIQGPGWGYGPAGRRVEITTGDGRRRELVLADYY